MTREYIHLLPDSFMPYSIAPGASEREYWESMAKKPIARLILHHASELMGQRIPDLSASLYLSFNRTGNRSEYESHYFTRRRMLGTLALAYCLAPNEAALFQVIDLLWAIAEESSWCLPAHNSYIRDSEQLPLPMAENPIIDLFSAETAATLALVCALLKHDLDQVTPIISQRIEKELDKRIITPYLTRHFWWMGDGDEPMNNWTAWCTQNVLLTAFLTPLDDGIRKQITNKALVSLDCFLKDYGEDGCCSEGAQYYRHAALCLHCSLAILNTVTDSLFSELYRDPKIRNMASFIRHIHAQGPYYFNFADCSALSGPCTIREYLFAKDCNDEKLASFALASAASREEEERDLPQEINLAYRLLELIGSDEHTSSMQSLETQEDHYYPSVGIWISRDSHMALGVKAGGNDDSHNHNDSGSITLYKDGHPVLIDVGVETYTKQTFSKDRYSIWTMRSCFHNVTNFPPYEQQSGKKYHALLREKTAKSISLELTPCYPDAAGVVSYVRTVIHEKEQGISILEQVKGSVAPVLTLMCAIQPKIEGQTIHFGNKAMMQCSAENLKITLEPITVEDERLRAVWPKIIYRLLLHYTNELKLYIE